jgi:N-acetylglucosamine-6-sulfatase
MKQRWIRPAVLCALVVAMGMLFAYRPSLIATTQKTATSNISKPAKKPNIIFILTDDLAVNLVQYMPNVQAMQKEGTTFANYFVTDSLCCPSRSSIFTGKFPHNTGVFTNTPPDGGFQAFNDHHNQLLTFALALQHIGYRTAMLGKYLNGYRPIRDGVPPGWDEWDVAGNGYAEFNYNLNQNSRVVHYGDQPEEYLTDVLAGMADAFIRKSAKRPFFIEIATFAPHAPYIPAPRDANKFPGLSAPRSAAFAARPNADAPKWLKQIPPLSPDDIARIDQAYRMRAQSVQAVDQMIGQIRSTLAALSDDNTFLVFSSDNGLHMGEYSLRPGKMTPFETDIHVPLVIVGPGVAKGRVVNEIVENVDLCPTFTQLAGASSPTAPDGHSLVRLLRESREASEEWRHEALIEHRRPFFSADDPDMPMLNAANPTSYSAIRTENGLYVEYEDGETSYYDLGTDPQELKNIASGLTEANHKQLHDVLQANKQCQGEQACWTAQRMKLPH